MPAAPSRRQGNGHRDGRPANGFARRHRSASSGTACSGAPTSAAAATARSTASSCAGAAETIIVPDSRSQTSSPRDSQNSRTPGTIRSAGTCELQRTLLSEQRQQIGEARPVAVQEAAVAPARACTAGLRLDKHDVAARGRALSAREPSTNPCNHRRRCKRRQLCPRPVGAPHFGAQLRPTTTMLKKLASEGLVRHERYRGVELTAAGRRAAVEMIRHHRLIEQYLAQRLGVAIDRCTRRRSSSSTRSRKSSKLGSTGTRVPDARSARRPDPGRRPDHRRDAGAQPGRARAGRAGDRAARPRPRPRAAAVSLRHRDPPRPDGEGLAAEPFGGPLLVAAGGAQSPITRDLAALIGIA